MSMPVAFTYRLVGTGWSAASLKVGEDEVELTASYLGDALGELLEGMVALIDGQSPVRVSWEEEPGEYRFVFDRAGADVRVRVVGFEDTWQVPKPDEEGEQLFDATCPLSALLAAVAAGARRVLDEFGVDGYRAKWVEHDFPLAALQVVEHAVAERPPAT